MLLGANRRLVCSTCFSFCPARFSRKRNLPAPSPWRTKPPLVGLNASKYQLVIFLRGYKTVQTELDVEAGRDAQAVRVQLQPDDIYE